MRARVRQIEINSRNGDGWTLKNHRNAVTKHTVVAVEHFGVSRINLNFARSNELCAQLSHYVPSRSSANPSRFFEATRGGS